MLLKAFRQVLAARTIAQLYNEERREEIGVCPFRGMRNIMKAHEVNVRGTPDRKSEADRFRAWCAERISTEGTL